MKYINLSIHLSASQTVNPTAKTLLHAGTPEIRGHWRRFGSSEPTSSNKTVSRRSEEIWLLSSRIILVTFSQRRWRSERRRERGRRRVCLLSLKWKRHYEAYVGNINHLSICVIYGQLVSLGRYRCEQWMSFFQPARGTVVLLILNKVHVYCVTPVSSLLTGHLLLLVLLADHRRTITFQILHTDHVFQQW